jgi:hypothetical protein
MVRKVVEPNVRLSFWGSVSCVRNILITLTCISSMKIRFQNKNMVSALGTIYGIPLGRVSDWLAAQDTNC